MTEQAIPLPPQSSDGTAIGDRFAAVAVGAALGDALGMPLEFGLPRPAGRLVRDMLPARLPAGTFTDDTEMALTHRLPEITVAAILTVALIVAWKRIETGHSQARM